jgi:conjugative relaxase-like TrwC/TraI family protein
MKRLATTSVHPRARLTCKCACLIPRVLIGRDRGLSGWCVRFVSASAKLTVLTIGKLGTGRGQLEYYEQQVAAGIEDYYAGRGECGGTWRGSGLGALGLVPGQDVERRAFMALMQGLHPGDRSVLRPMGPRSKVAALTFSAPKSVSVLFAIGDDRTSFALLEAHERAVDAALAYLEREACWTRRGRWGAEHVRGEGFIAASYRHRMSRAGDPQLHTHVVVANMTRAAGKYTALDAHSLYENKSAAGAFYRAALRAEVRERLPWVRWREAGRGLFEIEGLPDGVLRHFSQRRAEIEQRAMELVSAGAGPPSRELMQGIALATRRAKDYGVNGSTWREQAQARAAEHGFGQAELEALVSGAAAPREHPDFERLFGHLSGPKGLTEKHNTFARRHVLAQIAGAFRQGATAAELEQVTIRYLDDPTVRALGLDRDHEARHNHVDLLACEREIVDGAERRGDERSGMLAPVVVDRVVSRWQPTLTPDQTAAVRAFTSSRRGVDVVEALAGTGKTTIIGALSACYGLAGWQVVGAAPTGRAARELREAAEIPATTMHALVAELDQSNGFGPRTVLVLDEAGMAPTRLTARLFAHAERAGVKVIAVGDSGQLGSVEAGGWLAALARQQRTVQLREVMRQRDADERAALEALRGGEPERYLAHKQDDITVHPTEAEALSGLVEQWHAAQREHDLSSAVMIARDNHTREQLNRAARMQLKRDGVVAPLGIVVAGREFAKGDRVIARRNDRELDVDNGTLGTIVGVSPLAGYLRIQTDSRHIRDLDRWYVAAHLEHAYALTGHGAQSGTVSWAGVIGRPAEFTREWAYTALSRARVQTVLHVISERSDRELEPEEYGPPVDDRDRAETRRALHTAMKRSETERLATEQTQPESELNRRLAEANGAREGELKRFAEQDVRAALSRPPPPPVRGPATRWSVHRGQERERGLER